MKLDLSKFCPASKRRKSKDSRNVNVSVNREGSHNHHKSDVQHARPLSNFDQRNSQQRSSVERLVQVAPPKGLQFVPFKSPEQRQDS